MALPALGPESVSESAGRLDRDDGHEVAWRRVEGRGPTLVWCGGTRSDMHATKASALADWAARAGRSLLRFDYFGHGESSGTFGEGMIGRWRSDALAAIDALTEGPLVLVGSSMGGWIATLAALARPERMAGLVLIAPAPDYPTRLGAQDIDSGAFVEDARRWEVLPGPLAIDAPVRILQGGADPVVPWRHALLLAEAFAGPDVVFTLVRDADHRLARPQDLARLLALVEEVASR